MIHVVRIRGIAVNIHITFLLVLFWGAWQGWLVAGLTGILPGVMLVLLLFAAVLAHEFGHALAAQALGIAVREIVLLPVGGVAYLEVTEMNPWHELLFTVVGPLVNLSIAILLAIMMIIMPNVDGNLLLLWFAQRDLSVMVALLFWVNLSLFLFNMIPAFPIDGGRILRAGLALMMPIRAATLVAVIAGYIVSGVLVLLGLMGASWPGRINPIFLLLAVIVVLGSRYEWRAYQTQRAFVELSVGQLVLPVQQALAPSDTLSSPAVRSILRGSDGLAVMVDGKLVGLVSHRDLLRRQKSQSTIAHIMETEYPVMSPQDALWVALRVMEQRGLDVLPVMQDGTLLGLISATAIQSSGKLLKTNR